MNDDRIHLEIPAYSIDLIVRALEFYASQGGGMGDLEIAEILQLSNTLAAAIERKTP